MPFLMDTGALYALADSDDAWHGRMRTFIEEEPRVFLVPVTVLPETTYLLRSRLGPVAENLFIASVAAGEMSLEGLRSADVARTVEIMKRYAFLGFVDASLVAIAERLRLAAIVTTDRRNFRRIKPKHVKAFELLP
ncbi:MAG TPA: PIN domain-containing protein [Thermoanaerobaculia bacterium]|nr:PIN domain-containing protein [Thermoanaerobaculia bacterium]